MNFQEKSLIQRSPWKYQLFVFVGLTSKFKLQTYLVQGYAIPTQLLLLRRKTYYCITLK